MHIPEGYLSPQTTIPAVAAMVPIWGGALRKVKKTMERKSIPSLALCAAFSFLIMMFNVPVAGGSSAHAVGAVFIAILLGPWAAVISVSTALFIQAFVFGDGGILALGINCLNMAVIMPFAGYFIYKAVLGKAQPGSRRGLAAAFAGSYFGLNLAALAAALEFGIQPILFHAADGTPLYCPYPISVSVPAMMFDHLVIAGPIEGAVTAAAIAYIAKFAPQFLRKNEPSKAAQTTFLQKYKTLLIPLLVMLILTPLGILATGTAFGEESVQEIQTKLGYVPKGLSAIAEWWHAILPDYSVPSFGNGLFGSATGYVISAVIGVLLILAVILVTSRLVMKEQKENR